MLTLAYDEVAERLFVGSYPQTPEDIAHLKALGVNAVLNLQDDEDLERSGVRWDLIARAYFAAGILAVREPVEDFSPKALLARLPACVAALDRLHRGGRTVYLHCTAGVNRSPTVAIAWLHEHHGLSVEDATKRVTSAHECMPYRVVLDKLGRR